LSKREEEGRGPLTNKKGSNANIPRQPAPAAGQKRKSDAGVAAPKGKKGKKNTGAANVAVDSPPVTAMMGPGGMNPSTAGFSSSKGDSASPNFEDMDSDEDEAARIARGGKPETEEEKRKNFLERNRQGET
jgi:ATF/CREB family transcription factor